MNLPNKIKGLRKQYNLSQEQLTDKIGVLRQVITKWETGGGLRDILSDNRFYSSRKEAKTRGQRLVRTCHPAELHLF